MTVRELIVALLDQPMNAVVEVDSGDRLCVVSSVTRQAGVGYGLQYVTVGTDVGGCG